MQEILQNFEQAVQGYPPAILVAPGLVLVVAGICLWLGGLKLAKPIVLILAASVGILWLASTIANCGFCASLKSLTLQISALVQQIAQIIIDDHTTVALIAGGCGVAVIVLMIFWRRLAWAVIWTLIGTVMIFMGMILLLLNKGSAPISYIHTKYVFFAACAGVMLIFGSGVQLLLCVGRKNKADNRKDDKGEKE